MKLLAQCLKALIGESKLSASKEADFSAQAASEGKWALLIYRLKLNENKHLRSQPHLMYHHSHLHLFYNQVGLF